MRSSALEAFSRDLSSGGRVVQERMVKEDEANFEGSSSEYSEYYDEEEEDELAR